MALKTLKKWGVLAGLETTYNDGTAVAANADGLLVLEQPTPRVAYANEGMRRGETGPMAVGLLNVPPSGAMVEDLTLIHEAAGYGAAYSAANFPSCHVPLVAAGFDPTLDDTGSAESYTYILGDGGSLAAEIYTRQQMYALDGCYTDLLIEADGPEIPVWSFPVFGLITIPTESAVPSITSYNNIAPPKAVSMTITMGLFGSAVVRQFSLALNRTVEPRLDQNGAGHAGFSTGVVSPELTTIIEADTFVADPYHAAGGINPYELIANATALALVLTVGSVQYNKYTITAPQAQLKPLGEDEDGPTALWELTWRLPPSAPHLLDNFDIVFD